MGSQKLIDLINEAGERTRVEVICTYEYKNIKYIIYTKNEKTIEGYCIIYTGKIVNDNHKKVLVNISDGEEWEKIKEIMKKMTKYSLDGEEYDD